MNINYGNYDKIVDELYQIAVGVTLKFNLVLSKKMKSGKRFPCHHEYMYTSNKFSVSNNLITVKRNFDYYLSIDFRLPSINGETNNRFSFAMIRVENILLVQQKFIEAYNLMMNNIVLSKGKRTILKGTKPVTIMNLPVETWIKLQPVIIKYQNGEESSGMRIYISSEDNYVDIKIDKFMGLLYLLQKIDMYQSASIMMNYIQRPPFGTNLNIMSENIDLDQPEDNYEMESKTTAKTSRKFIKKKRSVFDEIDDM